MAREDDFNRAARRLAARLPQIQARHIRAIVAELERAQRRIVRLIRQASTDAGRAHVDRIQREITAQLLLFRRAAEAQTAAGIEAALAAGRDVLTGALRAAGITGMDATFRLDPRALAALRFSAIERIQDVAAQARTRITAALSQGLIGTLRLDQVIDRVNRILGGNARRRAMTIAYTEIGRAYSVANYESVGRAHDLGVKVALRWQQSGKLHPRVSHVNAHNQLVRYGTPFSIVDTKTGEEELLRFPRDPQASAGNTINCGCIAVPVVDGSSFDEIDARTGEVRRRVVVLPDDPNAAPLLLTPAERDAQNRALFERVQARLRAAGLAPGVEAVPFGQLESLAAGAPVPGFSVTSSENALGALASTALETQIALWWSRPVGTQSVGAVSSGVVDLLGARSTSVSISPWTRKKQLANHPEVTAEDYARLPGLLRNPQEVFASRDRHVAIVAVGGVLWMAVLKVDGNGRLWLQSFRRTSAADVARERAAAQRRRSRPGGGSG